MSNYVYEFQLKANNFMWNGNEIEFVLNLRIEIFIEVFGSGFQVPRK